MSAARGAHVLHKLALRHHEQRFKALIINPRAPWGCTPLLLSVL